MGFGFRVWGLRGWASRFKGHRPPCTIYPRILKSGRLVVRQQAGWHGCFPGQVLVKFAWVQGVGSGCRVESMAELNSNETPPKTRPAAKTYTPKLSIPKHPKNPEAFGANPPKHPKLRAGVSCILGLKMGGNEGGDGGRGWGGRGRMKVWGLKVLRVE